MLQQADDFGLDEDLEPEPEMTVASDWRTCWEIASTWSKPRPRARGRRSAKSPRPNRRSRSPPPRRN